MPYPVQREKNARLRHTQSKWNKIYSSADRQVPQACFVLRYFECFLPLSGTALDVACGPGGNALMLAQNGLVTTAVDISDRVIETLAEAASNQGLMLETISAPAEDWFSSLDRNLKFDVIVVSRFLDRSLAVTIIDRLKDNGLLYYQTFIRDKVDASVGPSNPDYLLAPNELAKLFELLEVRAFYDPGRAVARAGDPGQCIKNESYIVAQKMVKHD